MPRKTHIPRTTTVKSKYGKRRAARRHRKRRAQAKASAS